MDKEALIKIAEKIYSEAEGAYIYRAIMRQYIQHANNYPDVLKVSAVFHETVYKALDESCFMKVAKLYERTDSTVSVGTLLKQCEENIEFFPEYQETITITQDDKKYPCKIRYQHRLEKKEEVFYKDRVSSERQMLAIFECPDAENVSIRVDLTFPELLELYKKRFQSYRKHIESIRIQRNKIFAHNDMDVLINDESIQKKHPVLNRDIDEMIHFALTCTSDILSIIKEKIPYDLRWPWLDDLENTLVLTRIGIKYHEYELKEKERKIKEEIKHRYIEET